MGVVALLMAPLIAGRPHTRTVSDRIANGIQALATCPAVCLGAVAGLPLACTTGAAARSSSKRQMRSGRQNRTETTVASNETAPPAMSTGLEATGLDQRYWVRLNEP